VRYALPTETWREVVARRERYKLIRNKLESGEVRSIDQFVTYNLDSRRFAEEVIANCEGTETLRSFYKAIRSTSVLDPACGSGAFLFAALNILEGLYDACLVRMQAFVDDLDRSGEKHSPDKLKDFRQLLDEMNDKQRHPSPRYFILKSIILNNIYGVDIMEEATEICKLRLFLKLVAQVSPGDKIEPLPDIDFNVRAGNALVGFASENQLDKSLNRLSARVYALLTRVFQQLTGSFPILFGRKLIWTVPRRYPPCSAATASGLRCGRSQARLRTLLRRR
jgi:hypothetical protein